MYKSSQPQVAFGQSAAPGISDNEWTCATAFIQGICPAWNVNCSWTRGDADHSSETGNGHPLSHVPTLRIHVTLQIHLSDIFTNT